jgi:hypothetical protein
VFQVFVEGVLVLVLVPAQNKPVRQVVVALAAAAVANPLDALTWRWEEAEALLATS